MYTFNTRGVERVRRRALLITTFYDYRIYADDGGGGVVVNRVQIAGGLFGAECRTPIARRRFIDCAPSIFCECSAEQRAEDRRVWWSGVVLCDDK